MQFGGETLGTRNELEVSQSQPRNVFSAFRERSWRFRGNSSNAFFLRSAALGKRCILHIEYFIESSWLWHLIRSSCWGMRKLTSCPYSCLQLQVKTRFIVINFRIPGHSLASLWMTSMLFVIPWSGLKRKRSGRIFIRLTLSGRGIHRITVQMTCYFKRLFAWLDHVINFR